MTIDQGEFPQLKDGNDLTLSVNITRFNLPLTNIMWSHDGNILASGIDNVTITNSALVAPPVIYTLQRPSLIPLHSGIYIVTAINEAGTDNFTFFVTLSSMFLEYYILLLNL